MQTISLRPCGSRCLDGVKAKPVLHQGDTEGSQSQRVVGLSRLALVLLLGLAFAGSALAQSQTKRNDRPPQTPLPNKADKSEDEKLPDATRYRWEFAQPNFIISHIVVEHDGMGRGRVSFEHKGEAESITEPVELSPATRARIFGLWHDLRFLDSNENYQASKDFAHLGTYTLAMDDSKRKRTAAFNWSDNSDAWKLAQEYRRVADQAIFIFDITVARENQPLNTPGLLNQLESLYTRNGLSDPKQLVPLLKELRTDERIPLIARNQADRLLKKIEK